MLWPFTGSQGSYDNPVSGRYDWEAECWQIQTALNGIFMRQNGRHSSSICGCSSFCLHIILGWVQQWDDCEAWAVWRFVLKTGWQDGWCCWCWRNDCADKDEEFVINFLLSSSIPTLHFLHKWSHLRHTMIWLVLQDLSYTLYPICNLKIPDNSCHASEVSAILIWTITL